MNILHITPDFNYACGRSYYVYLLIKYFHLQKHNIYLATNGGDSFDRISELNVPVYRIKGLKTRNPISISGSIKSVRDLLIEHNIDLIHTHHRYSELIANQAKKLIRSKKIASVHTALSIVNKRYGVEYKSDKIISVSNTIYRMLIDRFEVNSSRIEMIPNFVDTEEIKIAQKSSRTSRYHRTFCNILAVGRFHHDKDFETLLKAMNKLGSKDVRLILVGEGDKYIDYRTYIKKHRLNVEIIVPQRNLDQYFQLADVCILPSIRDPFPNFMLQSGLHMKPFIGANVDGIAELIISGHNGLLFESGDYEELAEKILMFKSNRKFADTCADNLHSSVKNNYTQQIVIPQVTALYYRLLDG